MAAKKTTLATALGARIAALRVEANLTQEKCAWESGISSKGYMSRIESGQRLPSLATLEKLAERLGVEVRDLLIFPEEGVVGEAMERVRVGGEGFARAVMEMPVERAPTPPTRAKRSRRSS